MCVWYVCGIYVGYVCVICVWRVYVCDGSVYMEGMCVWRVCVWYVCGEYVCGVCVCVVCVVCVWRVCVYGGCMCGMWRVCV